MPSPPLVIDATSHHDHLHYKAAIESDYLGQWDLIDPRTGKAREPTVVIESIRLFVPPVARFRKTADGRKVPEKLNKYEVRFRGKRKAWISGPATQSTIASLYGTNLQAWIGKEITLYVDAAVAFGRKTVGGIRVRNTRPTEPETEDPLDNAVDERVRAMQEEAFAEEVK